MARGEEDRELEEFLRSAREDMEMHRTFSNDGPPPPQSHLHRVPERLRKMKESAYTPSLVSIGPIHKNATHLKDMEKVKLRYMHYYLRQTNEEQTMETIRRCMNAMLAMVSHVRNFYSVNFEPLNDVEFAKMMLIDGCFILTYLILPHTFLHSFNDSCNVHIDHLADDPIFGYSVTQDLLLLENQIPYSVLQELFRYRKSQEIPGLPTLVFNLFRTIVTFGRSAIAKSRFDDYIQQGRDIPHILHLLHISILPLDSSEGILPSLHQREFVSLPIESKKSEFARIAATELHRYGLKFVGRETENLELRFYITLFLNIEHRPILEIPKLYIHDSTEPLLRNLIAYERCYTGKHLYLTSYAYLMNALIDSVEDVELLEREGILLNDLGSSEKLLHLFNNLCNEIFLGEKFYFFEEWEKVNKHYNQWRRESRNLEKLKRHDYFGKYVRNPWTLISVFGALVLFILTLLQTIYTIRGYYKI